MKKIIYILSKGHSGSTLLEYFLAQAPNAIGIGELYNACEHFTRKGFVVESLPDFDKNLVLTNPFWQFVIQESNKYKERGNDLYLRVYEAIMKGEQLASYDTIIDSSKNIDVLENLSSKYKKQLNVLLIVKDVRAWVTSSIDNKKRKNRPIRLFESFYLSKEWQHYHQKLPKTLNNKCLDFKLVSYEEFCLDHEQCVEHLSEYLNIPLVKYFPDVAEVTSINILGNRMRYDFNNNSSIKYDFRWFYRNEWILPYILIHGLKHLQKKISNKKY